VQFVTTPILTLQLYGNQFLRNLKIQVRRKLCTKNSPVAARVHDISAEGDEGQHDQIGQQHVFSKRIQSWRLAAIIDACSSKQTFW